MPRASERARRGQKKQDARLSDAEFAAQVLVLSGVVSEGSPMPDRANKDAATLAASLVFLLAQAQEYIQNCVEDNDPNGMIAVHASHMIASMLERRAHPIHQFFRGVHSPDLGTQKKVTRQSLIIKGILAGCVQAVLHLRGKSMAAQPSVSQAISTVFSNENIKTYCGSDKSLRHIYSEAYDGSGKKLRQDADSHKEFALGFCKTADEVVEFSARYLRHIDGFPDGSKAAQVRSNRLYATAEGETVTFELPPESPLREPLKRIAKQGLILRYARGEPSGFTPNEIKRGGTEGVQ